MPRPRGNSAKPLKLMQLNFRVEKHVGQAFQQIVAEQALSQGQYGQKLLLKDRAVSNRAKLLRTSTSNSSKKQQD